MAKALVLVFVLGLLSCQSAEKRRADQLDSLAGRYSHLSRYHQIQCNVTVQLAEPAKSAWLTKLFENQSEGLQGSNGKVFSSVEATNFNWRSTPYRCQINAERSDESGTAFRQVLEDVSQQLNTVICVWFQSFYADSPLRGWRKGEGLLTERGGVLVIEKVEGRRIEFKDRNVSAYFGEGSRLSADYESIGGKEYPAKIESVRGDKLNQINDIVYTHNLGREIPKSLWLNTATGGGQTSAYFQVKFDQCRWD